MKIKTAILSVAVLAAMPLSASTIVYVASLNGLNEAPPNGSAGFGSGIVTIDDILNTMRVQVSFGSLGSNNTAAHIHCCTLLPLTGTAGVATVTPTFTGFPSGTTAGTYDHIFDLTVASTYNPAFVTAQGSLANAQAALLGGLAAGTTYLNIHTTTIPTGEIRGFLVPAPEPASLGLVGLSLAGLLFGLRRRISG